MKLLNRNLKPFHYCLYVGEQTVYTQDGYETGSVPLYGEPLEEEGNISASQGQAQVEMFGNADFYSKVIIVDDIETPIDENTVLFVDKEPEFTTATVWVKDPENPESFIEKDVQIPVFDYVVKLVAKSLNSISYAIDRVEVQ